MPYAQWGLDYEKLAAGDPQPFNKPFDQNYPADFIAEGVDQTRGWFYTLHAISSLLYEQVAYKTCVSNGLVLDKNGNKMSKHGRVLVAMSGGIESTVTATTIQRILRSWRMGGEVRLRSGKADVSRHQNAAISAPLGGREHCAQRTRVSVDVGQAQKSHEDIIAAAAARFFTNHGFTTMRPWSAGRF